MTAASPFARVSTAFLVVLGAALAAANWMLDPGRRAAWASALLFLGVLALVSWLSNRRRFRQPPHASAAASVDAGVVFAALMIALPLGVKLTNTLGMTHDPGLAQRLTMVVLGAFFAFTGNALPKMLTPLASLQCDASVVQAAQRFSGWTWVITGLTYSTIWLVFPVHVAEPLSVAAIAAGMVAVATHCVRLRQRRHREA